MMHSGGQSGMAFCIWYASGKKKKLGIIREVEKDEANTSWVDGTVIQDAREKVKKMSKN